jgi:hypothetical protein
VSTTARTIAELDPAGAAPIATLVRSDATTWVLLDDVICWLLTMQVDVPEDDPDYAAGLETVRERLEFLRFEVDAKTAELADERPACPPRATNRSPARRSEPEGQLALFPAGGTFSADVTAGDGR